VTLKGEKKDIKEREILFREPKKKKKKKKKKDKWVISHF